MATVNFSVPADVKQLFNETFANRNKSAVIAELMLEAVERERRRGRRAQAIDHILARRRSKPAVSADEIRRARDEGRP
ncbi:MAG: hypothetical protein ACREXW_00045 [Gammaproteobacteria bacterium]